MIRIVLAQTDEQVSAVATLFKEYSEWCKQQFVATVKLSPDAPELNDFNNEVLPGKYVHPEGCLILAYDSNIPVGCMFMRKLFDTVCELKRFYISPAGRGKGLAPQMLDVFCQQARMNGYTHLRICSHSFMGPAIGIYRKYGFQEITNYMPDPLQAGDVQMELDLYAKSVV